ncbi:A disintegrin and metalloproteinase with thrombospondin motifs 7 [Lingula anatina]|uniref:A disintegrin and metalloproteinase with thrombospondin motifs 7 n=1 Tax=Lingula anatina TaxID=7574 RepID=A0A1S3K1D7_LINAN|nr:A disintegrin and metalloproteinase with thrombospondin motifs 7 [Lingula anatina]|eukprot:XP_013416347.1 A disintegrin and metalloproteinase with thrombospondin motifs 7 [Lingula anatina]
MKLGLILPTLLLRSCISCLDAAHIDWTPEEDFDFQLVTLRELPQAAVRGRVERGLDENLATRRYQFDAYSKHFDLRLHRNSRIDINSIPMYYVADDGSILKKEEVSEDDFVLYQDKSSNAAVGMSVVADKEKLEGFVVDGDTMYELRHVADDNYHVVRKKIESINSVDGTGFIDTDTEVRHFGGTKEGNAQERRSAKTISLPEPPLLRTKRHGKKTKKTKTKKNKKSPKSKGSPRFSGNHIDACVELLILSDDSMWDFYMARNDQNVDKTERELKRLYAKITNMLDLTFQRIEDPDLNIHVMLSAYVIVTNSSQAPGFGRYTFPGEPERLDRVLVDGYETYDYWREFLQKSYNSFPKHDHGMAFTRRDITSRTPEKPYLLGLANVGAICNRAGSTSLVEDSGLLSYLTAAHELGHSLGALHDVTPACRGHLMTASIFEVNVTTLFQYYKFSSCSIEKFKETLTNACCLADSGQYENEKEFKHMTKKLHGEQYNADEQCQLVFGNESKACTPIESPEFCHFLLCNTTTSCHNQLNPMDGTFCGKGKWCIEGDCVSKRAPLPSHYTQRRGASGEPTSWCSEVRRK